MARKNRELQPMRLSFLDVMACGFGAATLLFLIIKHVPAVIPADPTLKAEVLCVQGVVALVLRRS